MVHAVQEEAWESGLGDMLAGYTIIAVLDQATRPAHAARNGQQYFREPTSGQRGFDEMPRPPLEADGSMAWNCRCTLSPIMTAPDTVPVGGFETAEDKLVSDPATYGQWFANTTDRKRRLAVGSRRYAAGQQAAGEEAPDWEMFISPDGELMPVADLQAESPADRAARLGEVRAAMTVRREALRRAYLGAGV